MAPKPVATPKAVTEAQDRQEQKAIAQETTEMAQASARMRTMRTGGLRLLFSPVRRTTSEGTPLNTKLGSGQ